MRRFSAPRRNSARFFLGTSSRRLRVDSWLHVEIREFEFGDAIDQPGDLFAELGLDLVDRLLLVLGHIVQQRGGDALGVHFEVGQGFGGGERVSDVGVAGQTFLVFVGFGGELIRPPDKLHIGLRVV